MTLTQGPSCGSTGDSLFTRDPFNKHFTLVTYRRKNKLWILETIVITTFSITTFREPIKLRISE